MKKPVKHAKKYARMFLNAVGLEAAPGAIEELALVSAVMAKSPEFRSALLSPVFTEAERKAAIGGVAGRLSISEHTVKFVGYLSEVKAAAALGKVIEAATAIYLEKKRRTKATVITPAAIDRTYEGRLRESLKRLTGKDVDLDFAIDPSLLGGMLIKVGSTMYDGSVRGQLRLLKNELVKG